MRQAVHGINKGKVVQRWSSLRSTQSTRQWAFARSVRGSDTCMDARLPTRGQASVSTQRKRLACASRSRFFCTLPMVLRGSSLTTSQCLGTL